LSKRQTHILKPLGHAQISLIEAASVGGLFLFKPSLQCRRCYRSLIKTPDRMRRDRCEAVFLFRERVGISLRSMLLVGPMQRR
jgi:hypothetical protein